MPVAPHWTAQLFHESASPKFIYDVESLRYLEVNAAAVAQYGFSRDEFLAMTVADLRPPEDEAALQATITAARTGARGVGRWRHRTRDGTLLEVEIFAEPLDFLGRAARLVTVLETRPGPAADEGQAQRQLRSSNEYYRLIVETAAEGIWILDGARRTTFVNQRLVEILGYPMTEMLGRPLWDWMDEESAASCYRVLGDPASRAPEMVEYGCLRKDGAPVRLRLALRPMGPPSAGEDSVPVLAMVTDITRSYVSEERLRKSERRFRAVIEHAQDIISARAPDPSGSFVSPSVSRVLGYSVEEYLAHRLEDVLHPDDRAQMREKNAQLLRSPGVPVPARYRLRHKDGSWRWMRGVAINLLDEPDVSAVVSNEQDDTERTAAEEALRASERRFRTLIESGPDAIGVSVSGRAVYANPRLASLMGFDLAAAQQVAPQDFIEPSDLPLMQARVGRILGGEVLPPFVYNGRRASGERRRLEVNSLPIEWEGAPALLSVFRDVTEREQIEARLIVADRIASIGTLAAGVAHEINNPLAYVLANLAHAREQVAALPMLTELTEALAEAQLGAERVRGIVRDLKTLSRPDETRSDRLDVHKALDMSASMAWNEIRHRARLVKDYGRDLPDVSGTEGRLGQVFLNLLINAAHAIREGAADSNEIRLVTRAEAGRVIVEVRDTGGGIAPEHRKRLFDPFFTTKPQGVGTGLGLSICHTIITGLGGEISFETEPGRGTVFRVALPVAAAEPVAAPRPPAPLPSTRRGRVLVIDDEPLVGKAVMRALQKQHDVTAVTRAPEALRLLGEVPAFDLIFCDLMMPEMTGIEFHEQLARSQPAQVSKVVFLTGGAFTDRAQAFLDGVDNPTMTKPFDLAELRRFVQARVDA
jgi:two-component system cell cycle sensor histidine kinase/response regulator CckA